MPTIYIKTILHSSDIQRCFDIARSIDLHKDSMMHTKEKAIAGKTSGLINLNEFVTWEAKHFGFKQQLTSKITKFNAPFHFRDEQQKGIFKYFIHDHFFELTSSNSVIMTDKFEYKAPLFFLGTFAELLFLNRYLKKMLELRNSYIKNYVESEKWKTILTKPNLT